MNSSKTKKDGKFKKHLAQDRLDRIREEQRLKRKIEEKLEKFDRQQNSSNGSSSKAFEFVEKFVPHAKQVEPRRSKNLEGCRQSTDTRLPPKNTSRLKPTNDELSIVRCSKAESVSKYKYTEIDKKKNTHNISSYDKGNLDNHVLPKNENSLNTSFSSGGKNRKRKRGTAAQRLEKIRKSAPKGSPEKNCSKPITDERNVLPRKLPAQTISITNQPPRQVSNRNSTGNAKQTQSHSRVSSPQKSITSTFIEPKLESKANLVEACSYTENDDESMDVDMVDLSENVIAKNTQSETQQECSLKEKSFIIDEIERMRTDSAYLVRHEDYIPDVDMRLSIPNGDFLIVVDTNIFLSHLKFLNRLTKSSVASYRSHVLVVPWLVIQEIDYAMKKQNPQLASKARYANYFIFDCMKKENSKFFGQSFEEFKVNFKNAVSIDDFLLQYCLKLLELRYNVVLLSDDKNLINKCMFSHVPAYTKDEFEKTFDIRSSVNVA